MCEQILSVMRPESLKGSDTSSDNLQGLLMFQEINVHILVFFLHYFIQLSCFAIYLSKTLMLRWALLSIAIVIKKYIWIGAHIPLHSWYIVANKVIPSVGWILPSWTKMVCSQTRLTYIWKSVVKIIVFTKKGNCQGKIITHRRQIFQFYLFS